MAGKLVLNRPTFGFAVATRVALGVGIGLLISNKMSAARRRAVGLALAAVGAATTVPVVRAVLRQTDAARASFV